MTTRAPDAIIDEFKANVVAMLSNSEQILDRIDTSTWASKDKQVFDSLVAEKQQLEKNHHKSAVGSVANKSQNNRKATTADLRGPLDWKFDNDKAGYTYTGKKHCAIDTDLEGHRCHHEICKTARNEGLSYLEYDTVTYYTQRIAFAKNSRMKDALRKQRDLQLLKDHEANIEWRDKAIKKFSSFGKEAGEAIVTAAAHLDEAVPFPPVIEPPENAVEQVGLALSALRLRTLPEPSLRYGRDITEFVTKRSDATRELHWRDPSYMVEYFAKVELVHLEAAMMNLRDVLELNNGLTYELDCQLRNFSQQLRTLCKRVPRSVRNVPGYTVREACQRIMRSLDVQPNETQPNKDQYLQCHLVVIMRKCLRLERLAREKMRKCCMASSPGNVLQKLHAIRADALEQSLWPSISGPTLDFDIQQGRLHALVHDLLEVFANPRSSNEAPAESAYKQLRDLFEETTDKFDKAYEELEKVIEQYNQLSIDAKLTHPLRLQTVIADAREKVKSLQLKHTQMCENAKQAEETTIRQALKEKREVKILPLPGMSDLGNEELFDIHYFHAEALHCHHSAVSTLVKYPWRGILEAFNSKLALDLHEISKGQLPDNKTTPLHYLRSWCTNETERDLQAAQIVLGGAGVDLKLFTQKSALVIYLSRCYAKETCLVQTTIRLIGILQYICAMNPRVAKVILGQMSLLATGSLQDVPPNWVTSLSLFSSTITKAYGHLIVEAMSALGRSDVEQITFTSLWILTFFTMVAKTPKEATERLDYALLNLSTLLNTKSLAPTLRPLFLDFIEYGLFCSLPGACTCVRQVPPTNSQPPPSIYLLGLRLRNKDLCIPETHQAVLSNVSAQSEMNDEIAARILKYVAHWAQIGSSFDLRPQDLQLLWSLFLRSEEVLGRTPHCSQNGRADSQSIGMHNQCNIWELKASIEKTAGFWRGYTLGFRNMCDVEALMESCKTYAFQHGSDTRLLSHIQAQMDDSSFPADVKSIFEAMVWLRDQDPDRPEKDTLQLAINGIDYIGYITVDGYDKPDLSFVLELVSWPGYFVDFLGELAVVVDVSGDLKRGQQLKRDADSLIHDQSIQREIASDDIRLLSIAQIAGEALSNVEHVDLVYSDIESDEDDGEDEFDSDNDSSEDDSSSGSGDNDDTYVKALRKYVVESASSDIYNGNSNKVNSRTTIKFKEPTIKSRGGSNESLSTGTYRSCRDRSPSPYPPSPRKRRTIWERNVPELQVETDESDESDCEESSRCSFCPPVLGSESELGTKIQALMNSLHAMKELVVDDETGRKIFKDNQYEPFTDSLWRTTIGVCDLKDFFMDFPDKDCPKRREKNHRRRVVLGEPTHDENMAYSGKYFADDYQ